MTEQAARELALEPLLRTLVERAQARGDASMEAARDGATRAAETARAQGEDLLAQARERGLAEAAVVMAADRAKARRAARAVVLAAQRQAWEELRRQAMEAVGAFLASEERRDRVESLIRAQLGPTATVRVLPNGGLVGETPDGRRVDTSPALLVDRALANFDGEQLWSAE